MNKLLCHPGRTFTLDELDRPNQSRAAEHVLQSRTAALSVSHINLNPVSDPDELEFLAGLLQFDGIPNKFTVQTRSSCDGS